MATADEGHLPPRSSVKRWLVTTNHKDIGILYLMTSLFFLALGGVLAMLIRVQMWESGPVILSSSGYYQVGTAHGFMMVFWFLSPFAFGFANYIVPLQIGADDLAFPRLNAMSYWLYLFSGILFAISFFQGATFMGGWTMYAPLNAPAFVPNYGQVGSFAAILALVMFTASVTIGSVNFLTTIYRMRAEGMRMRDIPIFSMSILLTVWMMLFAFAALLGALVVLSSDHLLHTNYFTNADGNATSGGSLLWTHLFWFFGHPEVYIVFFPALGAMAEIVQTFSGRRLLGRKWFVIAMALVAIQSFIVWMHHMFLTSINLPIKTIMMVTTIGISLPFDLMVFSLIYTMIKGRVRWKTPFLFVLGALIIFIIGGITGVFLGAIVLDYSFRGTYWVVAHFHYVMASGAVALVGALYYWYPKITGKMYNEVLGKAHFGLAFVSFNMLYFPMFIVWETPRRMFTYSAGFTLWHRVATVGAFLFAGSFLLMFYNLWVSLYSDRDVDDSPWAYTGSTEWAVSSPPPEENFPGKPSFATGSLRFIDGPEMADGGTETDKATDGGVATAEQALGAEVEEHADHASWWPMLVSSAALLVGLGLSGLSPSMFVWPLLFSLPIFVASMAEIGSRRDRFTPLHGIVLAFSFVLAAVMLIPFHLHHGVVAGLAGANTYFWLTMAGSALGAYSLAGMGFESFSVPEPSVSQQWPFEDVNNTKLGMWTFLASDILLFGTLIGSYIFTRFEFGWQDWWEYAHDVGGLVHHPVWPGLVNTYLLLASSFTVVLALEFARRGEGTFEPLELLPDQIRSRAPDVPSIAIPNRLASVGFMGVTFAGSALFLLNKGIEWVDLYIRQGWTFNADTAASTFYLTTGMHGAHVVVGMLIMIFLMLRTYVGAYQGEKEARTIEYFGLYWHFVDIVWLFLFPLFYIL